MTKPNIQVGITDHLAPDVNAMLMAMYSRSYVPIQTRIPSNEESAQEHREKLGKFYINYGHRSVGQLGSTTIWLEGVSMLAAKAIENHPLYNGQESSSRYISFATQPIISSNDEITKWQETFREFYIKAVPLVTEKLKKEFPLEKQLNIRTEVLGQVTHYGPHPVQMTSVIVDVLERYTYVEEKDTNGILTGYKLSSSIPHKEIGRFDSLSDLMLFIDDNELRRIKPIWENTIKARTFDICRGILPAGCATNVAFTGTFDTINDHFGEMLFHPCQEMRDIAEQVLIGLKEKYQYAAMDIDKLKERNSFVTDKFFYQNSNIIKTIAKSSYDYNDLDQEDLNTILEFSRTRKKWDKLPRYYASKWRTILKGLLDFGSYRDIHRHRNGYIQMPCLNIKYGFHDFYLNNLTDELKLEFQSILSRYEEWYNQVNTRSVKASISEIELQYCTPMGYRVPVHYDCDINQTTYLIELRSSKTVHQTLRSLIQEWTTILINTYGLNLHADMDKDNFSLKRGTQTFSTVEV